MSIVLSDYKFSSLWGLVGVVVGLLAFGFNYLMVPVSLPGYEVLVAPAIFALSFFSEETYFTPKMIIFLFGQYGGYFCFAYLCKKLKRKTSS